VPFLAVDRLVLGWVCQLLPKAREALAIVRPDTVMRWHRAGFRCCWRWRSRRRQGRPGVPAEIRQLIRQMSVANPLWGLAVVAAAYALILWAMRVNRSFSSVVRIQFDRGQRVVATGPYSFIRYPGYSAGILIVLASGIALGSWLATALLVVTTLPFLFYRAITEDCVLLAELPGYREYAGRVRWRLIPGVF
jgi:hypothetical protein